MNTHNIICDFGRHNGMLYTRMPISYLKWMIQSGHSKAEIAKAELNRRGTVTPNLEVSGHAIDRASLNCRKIWHETARNNDEGLHAWLVRICEESLSKCKPDEENIIFYNGMKLIFEHGEWPVLKTVMPCKNKSRDARAENCGEAAENFVQQPQADICPICQRKFYGSGVAGFCSDECNSMYYERI
jgi:hypothetical protein